MTSDVLAAVRSPPLPGVWQSPRFAGYAAHNAPVWRRDDDGVLAIQVTQARTNFRERLHGGMAMSLQLLAFGEAARRVRGAGVELVTFNCELLDSAGAHEWITASSTVERITRTLLFVTGRLACGSRVLMTASAVFAVDDEPARLQAVPDEVPAGWHMHEPTTPFCAHVGAMYERFDAQGERHGAFRVCERHLRADGAHRVDHGMLMMLADLYLGRRARQTMGAPCVTLGMTLSQTGTIALGDLVEIDSRAQGHAAETAIVTGRFRVNGAPVATLTSSWKKLPTGPLA